MHCFVFLIPYTYWRFAVLITKVFRYPYYFHIQVTLNMPFIQDLHPLTSLDDSLVQRKFDLCQNYLEVYSRVDPGFTKWRGHLLEELVCPMLLIVKWDQFKSIILVNTKIKHRNFRRKFERGECDKEEYDSVIREGFRMLKESLRSRNFDEGFSPSSPVAMVVKEFNDIIQQWIETYTLRTYSTTSF